MTTNKISKSVGSKKKIKAINLLSLFPDYRRKPYMHRAMCAKDAYVGELREAYLRKGLVLYVGAGVSQSIGLPGWNEMVRRISVTMMTQKVHTAAQGLLNMAEDRYWDIISKVQADFEDKSDQDKPILIMARALKDELGAELGYTIARILYGGRFRYYLMNRNRFNPKHPNPAFRRKRELPSSELLDAIVCLARSERDVKGVQAIINYNYDDILDEKLREQSVPCITAKSGKDRIPARALACYHVHGVLPLAQLLNQSPYKDKDRLGNFVFSEDEYHAEYSDPYRWSNMTQMSQLGRHTGLFLGLSMEDPNIRRLLDVTHKQYPEIKNYAIVVRKQGLLRSADSKDCVLRNLFEDVESRSLQKIGVNAIWADSFDEIPKLIRTVCEDKGE